MTNRQQTKGFTIAEMLVVILVMALLLTIVVPVLARARNTSGVSVSMNNLSTLGVAHEMYAADWNSRQATVIVDNFSTYGTNGTAAVTNYYQVTGHAHPGLLLGFCTGEWGYYMPGTPGGSAPAANWVVITPFDFASKFGYCRIPNSKALHTYVGGRFYDETFYAPNDSAVIAVVDPLFDNACGFLIPSGSGGSVYWSSYCTSPAAMFNPAVFRAPSAGGWQNPFSLSTGFASPNLTQAMYPALKTHMLEHHWNQNPPPSICNPAFPDGTYAGCEPYYFNLGLPSAPATLFYDGHVRLLPNTEVISADQQILMQTKGIDGLWSRDTPLGMNGYFGQNSYDGTIVSHHILTTNGILGRDTLANVAAGSAFSRH